MKKQSFIYVIFLCVQFFASHAQLAETTDNKAKTLSHIVFRFPHWIKHIEMFQSKDDLITRLNIPKQFTSSKDWTGETHSYIDVTVSFYPSIYICMSDSQCETLSSSIDHVRLIKKADIVSLKCIMQTPGSYYNNRRRYEATFSLEPYLDKIGTGGGLVIYPLLKEEGGYYLAPSTIINLEDKHVKNSTLVMHLSGIDNPG